MLNQRGRGVTQVMELVAAGVNVACGQDCVHDTFDPFGLSRPRSPFCCATPLT